MTDLASLSPSLRRKGIDSSIIWLGLFGVPVLWSVQELVGYAVVSRACNASTASTPMQQPAAVAGNDWVILVAINLVVVLLAIGFAVVTLRHRRAAAASHGTIARDQPRVAQERTEFLLFAGLLLSTLFLFGIALNLLGILMLSTCA